MPSEWSHFALVSYYTATSSSIPLQCLQTPAGRNVKPVKHHLGLEKKFEMLRRFCSRGPKIQGSDGDAFYLDLMKFEISLLA